MSERCAVGRTLTSRGTPASAMLIAGKIAAMTSAIASTAIGRISATAMSSSSFTELSLDQHKDTKDTKDTKTL